MNKCECDACEYCVGYGHYKRKGFHCQHPNYSHIDQYFKEHKISKMVAFIGFGEKFSNVPKNKTTPKWCPKNITI